MAEATPPADTETATPAPPGATPAPADEEAVTEATIVMGKPTELAFDPRELTIPANTDVTITLRNDGVVVHDFHIRELKVHLIDVQPGDSMTVTINAEPGEYEFYCDVPGHRETGMVGTLIVEWRRSLRRMTDVAELTELELVTAMPAEVAVGDEIRLKVLVQTQSGHDLCGGIVEVNPGLGDEAFARASLAAHVGPHSETEPFTIRAPSSLGRHEWLIRFPQQEIDGRRYGESIRQIAFDTRPQRSSLAVWAVPSPVPAGARFRIKTGAKSAGGCDLSGACVDVRDEAGTVLASGALSDEAWPGTAALHWTELELVAPEAEGMVTWTVTFAASERETVLPHEGSSARFSFATVRPPSARLSVRVVDQGSLVAIADAKVRLGAHRGATDETGLALLEVPDGTYTLTVWKAGYEAASQQLKLTRDRDLEIGLTPRPDVKEIWV